MNSCGLDGCDLTHVRSGGDGDGGGGDGGCGGGGDGGDGGGRGDGGRSYLTMSGVRSSYLCTCRFLT